MRLVFASVGAAVCCLLVMAVCLAAESSKPEGTLVVGKRTYKLTNVAAFETMHNDEAVIAIVASDRKLPTDRVKASLRKIENSTNALSLDQPYLLLLYNTSGELKSCAGNDGGGGGFSRGANDIVSDVTIENGKVSGTAKLVSEKPGVFATAFDLRLDVAVGGQSTPKPTAKPSGPVKPSVSGTFIGNGKAAKLAYVSALPDEPFNDKPSMVLIFSEKDHTKAKQPKIKAAFGDFGSALIVSLHEDGSIFGCQVVHSAHKKSGFSSIGQIRTTAFEVGDGRVEGELETDGEAEFFGDTWSVNLKFTAPFTRAAAQPAVVSKPSGSNPADTPRVAKPATKPAGPKTAAPKIAAPKTAKPKPKPVEPVTPLSAKQIPLSKDAADIQYQEPQITFKSSSSVKAVAAELAKALAAQGWKGGPDIVTGDTAVLARMRGDGSLSVIIKAEGKGCEVMMVPTDVEWTDVEK